jgi:ATP synthase subunit 6
MFSNLWLIDSPEENTTVSIVLHVFNHLFIGISTFPDTTVELGSWFKSNNELLLLFFKFYPMHFFSPLEQFSIIKIIPLVIGPFDISITNSTILVVIACFIAFLFYNFAVANAKLVPSAWQSTAEFIYEFIYFTVLSENVKKNGPLYFPVLFSIFSFIFFCNIVGMIPFSFTVTSHIVITLGLAILAFFGINVIGIKTHGFHLLSLFLPSGAPIALAPLLVVIEVVSYSFRVISLALRLFANMMSGHCLLKILAGFA